MSTIKQTPAYEGELLQFGPTTIRVLEDGSTTENRISAITSTMPPHTDGPKPHIHLMHDENFLITSGVLRFIIGKAQSEANVGDYIVVPVGTVHTFINTSNEPVSFFTTFTPGFYIESFRELARLIKEGRWNEAKQDEILKSYATVLV